MMILPRPALSSLFLALLLAGCASSSAPRSGSDPDEITRQEIDEIEATTAFEVVQRLRPLWLRPPLERSHNRDTQVVVVVNGLMMGGVRELVDIDAHNVRAIRWLDSAEAGRLPGLGSRHVAGAIVVQTL